MAGTSNAGILARKHEDLAAANVIVSNIVSVKLSCDRNYDLWKMQMLCLLESFNMLDVVDPDRPIRKEYDCLVKGWIIGSISEDLLGTVVDLSSAKEVWKKLKSIYKPAIRSSQQECADSAQTKLEAKTESKDKDVVSKEKEAEDRDVDLREMQTENIDAAATKAKTRETEAQEKNAVPVEKEAASNEKEAGDIDVDLRKIQPKKDIKERYKELCKTIVEGDWYELRSILREYEHAITQPINTDGNTVLHIAIGIGPNYLVKQILSLIKVEELPKMLNNDESTALHIAAIVGNTEAATLLIQRKRELLNARDKTKQTPLVKAYENMQLDTFEYLLDKAYGNTHRDTEDNGQTKDDGKIKDQGKSKVKGKTKDDVQTKDKTSWLENSTPGLNIEVKLLVNAVSSKKYDLAKKLVKKYPKFAAEDDEVLMAIARTFPSGLDYWEKLIYPILDPICKEIVNRAIFLLFVFGSFYEGLWERSTDLLSVFFSFYVRLRRRSRDTQGEGIALYIVMEWIIIIVMAVLSILAAPVVMFFWICHMIRLLILIVYFPFFMFYFLSWKVAKRLGVAPIHHIENKKKEWKEAKEVLNLVCDEIDKSEHSHFYTRPILEAARQNAYDVVDEILRRFPEAIWFTDEKGYDIIQLAVIHRSEKIYNLIHIMGEGKNHYRTIEDSSENNMLHLAGRLAPSQMLKRSIGAAFQLQRELQWRKEVKELVFPTFVIKENIFKETPDMVFTREHENLVKEGEKWMKAVAESCSITAGLIITIVFAAALTVPGGSNENNGIPLFAEDIAFTIFAVSDAMSLFASTTALLMFLSILTGRFAEQDFLFRLPKRLIIGLCTLMLSTTAMMVAFGSTLFLVFCNKRPWMLGPICVSAFLPIAAFATLQMPLIVDLFRSTYVRIFSTRSTNSSHRFNPNDIRLFFGK